MFIKSVELTSGLNLLNNQILLNLKTRLNNTNMKNSGSLNIYTAVLFCKCLLKYVCFCEISLYSHDFSIIYLENFGKILKLLNITRQQFFKLLNITHQHGKNE